jgi:hypothetical protein
MDAENREAEPFRIDQAHSRRKRRQVEDTSLDPRTKNRCLHPLVKKYRKKIKNLYPWRMASSEASQIVVIVETMTPVLFNRGMIFGNRQDAKNLQALDDLATWKIEQWH